MTRFLTEIRLRNQSNCLKTLINAKMPLLYDTQTEESTQSPKNQALRCTAVLNMKLQAKKVIGQKVQSEIYAFVVTPDYVAVGSANRKALVYDKRGNMLLVRVTL